MEKSTQKARNSAAAGRMKALRSTKFETQGFPSNGPVPSLSAAGAMWAKTKRAMGEVPKLISKPQGIA